MAATLTILDPIAPPQHAARALTVLDNLAGKTVGFIDNAKPNFQYLVDDLADLLVSKYKVAAVLKHRKPGQVPVAESVLAGFEQRCDAVITGSGD
jgi:hypothetical protein